MKSKEFLNESDDKNIDDVQANHPEIYRFMIERVGYMALGKQSTVEAYNTTNSHMVVIKIKPSAGLGNTKAGLAAKGIEYESTKSPFASDNRSEILTGTIGEMHWTVSDDNMRGNITETWRFSLPHADGQQAEYHDRTMEGVDGGTSDPKTKFLDAMTQAGLIIRDAKIEAHDDDWVKITARGVEHFRAGVPAKIQYVISAWFEPTVNEISGTVKSQASSIDKKYSKEFDMENDQFSLDEFANRTATFIADLAIAEKEQYAAGEKEYWAKGGRGMMPGSVTRK